MDYQFHCSKCHVTKTCLTYKRDQQRSAQMTSVLMFVRICHFSCVKNAFTAVECGSLKILLGFEVSLFVRSATINRDLKAWFHASEILREKLFMRNTDGWAWLILFNSLTFFAFAVSRTDFYSLVKRNCFAHRVNSMELFMSNHLHSA